MCETEGSVVVKVPWDRKQSALVAQRGSGVRSPKSLNVQMK